MSSFGVILLAVFRPDAALLERQVESLKAQSLREWRCFVGIDGRDPEVRVLIQNLVADDHRFRVFEYSQNVGHYQNFERLTQEVDREARWVAYCDQDDYWYPEKLGRLVSLLEAEPACAAAVGAARVVDRAGQVLGVTQRRLLSPSQLLLKNEVTGSLAVFRPEVVRLALPFPQGTKAAVHDHWLGVCASALGEVRLLAEPLQDYIQHGENAIGEARTSTVRSHLIAARASGGWDSYLGGLSREQWGWRVSMARTLLPRLDDEQARRIEILRSVVPGHLTRDLACRLVVGTLRRRVLPRTGLGMAATAMWWRRTIKRPSLG